MCPGWLANHLAPSTLSQDRRRCRQHLHLSLVQRVTSSHKTVQFWCACSYTACPAVTEGWSLEAMGWWPWRPGSLDLSELWALTFIPLGLIGTHYLDFSYSCEKHNDIWSAPAPVCALLTCQKVSDKLESAELHVSYQLLVLRVLQLDLQYHWITAWIFSCITYTNHKYLGCVLQSARKWAEIHPAAFTPLSAGINFQPFFPLRPDWNQWPRSKILCILLASSPWSCAV